MDSLENDNINPVGIYLFKVNNRNTRARCEICSKLTTKTPKRRHWHLKLGKLEVSMGKCPTSELKFSFLYTSMANP